LPLDSRSSVKKYIAKQNAANTMRMVAGINSLPKYCFSVKIGLLLIIL
jgi:hypothetical protein